MFSEDAMNRREASKVETRKMIVAAARKLLREGTHTEFTMRPYCQGGRCFGCFGGGSF